MVMANLHIICGNCGCNKMFEWVYKEEHPARDYSAEVYITCGNCATIHRLSDNATHREID
jgi:RNase P subunit RPR2